MISKSELFLAPCSREHKKQTYEHFEDTVLQGIPQDYYDINIGNGTGRISVWGVVSGNKLHWERLSQGDVILFYTMKGVYTHAARVYDTEKNEELAASIWSTYDGGRLVRDLEEPWPYLIYFYDVQRVDIPVEDLHPVLGWASDYPQRFTRVADDGQENIRETYGSIPGLIQSYVSGGERNASQGIEQWEQELINSVSEPPSLTIDRFGWTDAKRMQRDEAFRKVVRDVYGKTCTVCGASRTTPYGNPEIRATRIYPKSERGSDDIRNGLALCRLHNWAFNTGWFGLDPENRIVVRNAPDISGYEEFKRLTGRQIRPPVDQKYQPHELFTEAHRKLQGLTD